MIDIPKLNQKTLEKLQNNKNILAFSGGVDSTALFFILLKNNIDFDIAIFDYKMRKESALEVEYAKELASSYKKNIFIKSKKLENSNFEANAREARYSFFKSIAKKHDHANIITAHQLNDKVEWFFMQFTKGAGCVELFGMDYISYQDNYTIARPMLDISRDEILNFLTKNNIKYFYDSSNDDEKYKRNYFRKNITNMLVSKYKDGIKNSFNYLKKDTEVLFERSLHFSIKELVVLKRESDLKDIREIDFFLKRMGYIASFEQKNEILKTKDCVIGAKFVIFFDKELIFISPYLKSAIPKEEREKYRKAKIPTKIRSYLSINKIPVELLKEKIAAIFG